MFFVPEYGQNIVANMEKMLFFLDHFRYMRSNIAMLAIFFQMYFSVIAE